MTNKTILVTGAAGGIGTACVQLILKNDKRSNVVAMDRSSDLLAKLGGDPARLLTHAGDVAAPGDGEKAVKVAIDRFGRLDGLLHLAAIKSTSRWDELTAEEFNRSLEVNVTGSFLMAQAAARQMVQEGSGSIVLTSSATVAFGPIGGEGQAGPSYAASKGAVVALMRSLARALGPRGVRVNTLAPGITETPLIEGYTKQQRERSLARFPLGRFGRPEEIAEAALFLLSDRSTFITGQELHVNGGSVFS